MVFRRSGGREVRNIEKSHFLKTSFSAEGAETWNDSSRGDRVQRRVLWHSSRGDGGSSCVLADGNERGESKPGQIRMVTWAEGSTVPWWSAVREGRGLSCEVDSRPARQAPGQVQQGRARRLRVNVAWGGFLSE